MKLRYAVVILLFAIAAFAQPATPPQSPVAPWNFVVAGDSRNCGDVIMPAIAQGAKRNNAQFYWHLGDWRAIYTFDEDMVQALLMENNALAPAKQKTLHLDGYLRSAFQDAIANQLGPFDVAKVPVFAGIGNHETMWPMSRPAFVRAFHSYLDAPAIRQQRIADSTYAFDLPVETYYHVTIGGIDFISMDNGSCDMFDEAQMDWVTALLDRDSQDAKIHTIVVGMHAALPDSRSCGHSMGNYTRQRDTGRRVYHLLLNVRDSYNKQVYVLSSHSHFVMDNVYDTPYWHANGGVLPGWIVGTSGAVRYRLPAGVTPGPNTKTDVYGYLLGTVATDGSVTFGFHELTLADIPQAVLIKYSEKWIMDTCFVGNRDFSAQGGTCPPMKQCSPGD